MNRCPITYEFCGSQKYTQKGLKLLSKSLKHLNDFPYTPKEQIQKAVLLASKISIQGVQPKLSVILNGKTENFEIVEKGGHFIIKPPHDLYEQVPENEDFTMRLAKVVGIETPMHGMIYNIDESFSYFIKRFDRLRNQKIAVEDFSQLLGYSRETKYESSMEKVVSVIEKHCTFPILEKLRLFRMVIFNFIVGNEDMHLKNYSLIRHENKVELTPAYDLLNTSILMNVKEEIALPINGKKSNLKRTDFIEYFGIKRLGLTESSILNELKKFSRLIDLSGELINNSFLSKEMKSNYQEIMLARWKRIQ